MKRIGILILMVILTVYFGGMGMNSAMAEKKENKSGMIVVDPGFSKLSMKVARVISDKLAQKGYRVSVIPIDQFQVQKLTGSQLLVLGSPTYAGQPSKKLIKLLNSFNHNVKLKTFLFVTGSLDCTGLQPLQKLAEGQGLAVAGSCAVLANGKEKPNIENIVDRLLENIE